MKLKYVNGEEIILFLTEEDNNSIKMHYQNPSQEPIQTPDLLETIKNGIDLLFKKMKVDLTEMTCHEIGLKIYTAILSGQANLFIIPIMPAVTLDQVQLVLK